MGSVSCPHFDVAADFCLLLKTDCIPGRPGCVLAGKSKFAVPVEERIRARAAEKKAQRHANERK
jgi:hypothetical protein